MVVGGVVAFVAVVNCVVMIAVSSCFFVLFCFFLVVDDDEDDDEDYVVLVRCTLSIFESKSRRIHNRGAKRPVRYVLFCRYYTERI